MKDRREVCIFSALPGHMSLAMKSKGEYNHWIKKGQGRLVLALKKENTREFSRKEYLGTHIEGSVILRII